MPETQVVGPAIRLSERASSPLAARISLTPANTTAYVYSVSIIQRIEHIKLYAHIGPIPAVEQK